MASLLSVACGDAGPPASPEPGDGSSSGDPSEEGSSGEAPLDVPAGCGNGIVEADEECDLGFANAADGACTPTCAVPRCGDGFVGEGEACDEGEANGGPTCSEACTWPTRLRWSTTIGGSTHGWDLVVAMAPVADGSVVAALYVDDDPPQAVIERRDASGTRAWSTSLSGGSLRYYPLSAHLVPFGGDEVLLSMFADEPDEEGSERVELRRLDAAGETRWRHVVGSSALGSPASGRVTVAGDEVVLTVVLELADGQLHTQVTRLDGDGAIRSERMIEEAVWRTAGRADGGFFGHTNARLLDVSADDVIAWSVAAGSMRTVALVVDGQGRPITARRTYAGERRLEAWSADGRLRWEAALEVGPGALAVGPGGEIAVVGTANAVPGGLPTNVDLAVEAFDAAGRRRWIERIDGPAHGEDEGEAVAIATDGAAWVGGQVSVPFEERDAWLGRFEEEPR